MMRNLFLRTAADSRGKKAFNAALVLLALLGFLLLSYQRLGLRLNFSLLEEYRYRFLQGFLMTVEISVLSLIVSLIIGFVSAAGSRSSLLPVSYLSRAYVQLIRGTPLLVQIFFFYYMIGTAWGLDNRYIAGVLILSIFEGAYISEIIRGGLDSIEASQLEIAKAIGLTQMQTFRLVVARQLITRILPALAGQFASIIKDSSLLSVVALIELTHTTQEISATNYALFENYLLLGLLYFVLTFPVSLLTRWLERKYKYEN